MKNQSMRIYVLLIDVERNVDAPALINTGASGTFLDQTFAERLSTPLLKLKKLILVQNVDGTEN